MGYENIYTDLEQAKAAADALWKDQLEDVGSYDHPRVWVVEFVWDGTCYVAQPPQDYDKYPYQISHAQA